MRYEKSFAERVYAVCKRVPAGRVTTYKAIAEAMGLKAYRAVGNALHRNPYSPIVPCHRVVKSDGSLGGFATGLKRKIRLLKAEKIQVQQGMIQDFEKKVMKKIK